MNEWTIGVTKKREREREIFEKNFDLNNKNKIFFKSLGIALWDIAIAKGIYDLAT